MNAKDRSGRTLLIVLVAVLLVAATAAVWLLTSSPTLPSPDEGRPIADEFLQSIRNGRADVAWDSTTAEFKSAEGRETFLKRVKKTPVLKEALDFVAVQQINIGSQPRSEFLYRSSEGKSVHVLVGEEYGTWKVDRMTVD